MSLSFRLLKTDLSYGSVRSVEHFGRGLRVTAASPLPRCQASERTGRNEKFAETVEDRRAGACDEKVDDPLLLQLQRHLVAMLRDRLHIVFGSREKAQISRVTPAASKPRIA
jgi:hypothetical protein